jgi:UPF0176 protein
MRIRMHKVAALYFFAPFDDPAALQAPLKSLCLDQGVRGTLLLAREGINGTISGTEEGVAQVVDAIRRLPGCAALDVKYSTAAAPPFQRTKVRLKKEIVTLGVADVDPARRAGRYVQPEDWNDLISDPETIVIDTRNDYEVAIGSFRRALNPQTKSFGEFPKWFRAHRDSFGPNPRVAMFCTGGIRCEKSTAFLRQEGIEEVFHLKGGILNYLEKIPAEESLWEGDCFVFDERVSLTHGLAQGQYQICDVCTWPMQAGEPCAHCG